MEDSGNFLAHLTQLWSQCGPSLRNRGLKCSSAWFSCLAPGLLSTRQHHPFSLGFPGNTTLTTSRFTSWSLPTSAPGKKGHFPAGSRKWCMFPWCKCYHPTPLQVNTLRSSMECREKVLSGAWLSRWEPPPATTNSTTVHTPLCMHLQKPS